MAVNLSPVGGVAAQFFDNNGVPLAGGKLYTYAAGTTTPVTAYTSSQGVTAWSNPIILNSAGRVSGSGEIWITDGILYKFVLETSTGVLIATYDNISGINSNFIAFTSQQEIVTATASQTVFNLSISYQPGTNSLSVFVDGVNQYGPGAQYAYTETDSDTVTFTSGLHVGAEVKFTTTQQQGAGAVDASQVTYDPPFTGSVATNVEAKLAQTVSVVDFGAVGDGVTNASSAFTAALTASKSISIPSGDYLLSSSVTTDAPVVINGLDADSSLLTGGLVIDSTQTRYGYVLNVNLDGPNTGTGIGLTVDETHRMKFDGVTAREYLNGAEFNYAYLNVLINCEFAFNGTGALFKNFTNGTTAYSCTFANNTNHGATVKSSQKFMFHGCDFENNTNYGIVVDSADNGTLQNLNGTVDSCYFENNASDVIVGSGANAVKTAGWVFKDNCHLGSKVYGYLVDYASSTKIIRPDFTGAIFSAAAISLTANSEDTTIIPFVSAQVQAAAGATVSVQTIQTGSVDITLDGTGFGDTTITFPIQYFVVPPVNLTLYSNANPSGSLGTVSIKNGIGVTGIFIQVHGGPASTTVKVAWQAGS